MDFDKKLFFDNVSYLVRKSEKKIGDLEKAAGVSPGYISRTSKEGGAKPGIEFVMKIAEELHVSMDLLVRTKLDGLTQTETYLLSFLEKLRKDTEEEKLDWKCETAESLNRLETDINGNVEHPMFFWEDFDEEDGEGRYEKGGGVVFSSHAFGPHTMIAEDCYHLRLKNNSWLYLMCAEATKGASEEDQMDCSIFGPVLELWICMDGEYKPQFLCSTRDGKLATQIQLLHDQLVEWSKHPQLTKNVCYVIDAFMNGDVEDDPKPQSFGTALSDEEIPF